MRGLEVVEKDGLVVCYSISEPSERIEPSVNPLPRHVTSVFEECEKGGGAPNCCVITRPEQTNPKAKAQVGDNVAGYNRAVGLVETRDGLPDFLDRIVFEGRFAWAVPVQPVFVG